MLLLLLSTALLSFFAFGLLYCFNVNKIYCQTILNGKMTGEKTAKFTEEFAVEQATKHLMSLALEKARRMELGMSEIKYDAESIAKQMTQIVSEPDKYKEISIPKNNEKPIYSGEAYIHYAPEIERNGITSELKHEVGISSNIVDMSSDLKKYMENLSMITAEKERIATELNVARNIQTGLLPSVEPYFSNKKEFDLAVSMNLAKEVGGDFYDFYMLGENHLAVTIADVSGKGVGAALFMMISKTVLKNCAMLASSAYSEGHEPDLAFVIEQANQQLTENNKEFMFVTVFFGILDLKTGLFSYVNAGHNPPLVHHKNEGEFSFILNEKKNRVMGVRKNTKYLVHTLNLYSGDKLFFYTDGITEAMNKQKELFGEQRLKVALDGLKDCENAKEILSLVYNAVKQHACDAEQSDDMTMLGLVYK